MQLSLWQCFFSAITISASLQLLLILYYASCTAIYVQHMWLQTRTKYYGYLEKSINGNCRSVVRLKNTVKSTLPLSCHPTPRSSKGPQNQYKPIEIAHIKTPTTKYTGWSKKRHKVCGTIILQPYVTESCGFQQNVREEIFYMTKVSVWMPQLNILCFASGKWTIQKQYSLDIVFHKNMPCLFFE